MLRLFQIRVETQWPTAFICDEGQFALNRTPFSLKSAGYTFVKALQPVRDCSDSYIDDTAVYSYTWHVHLKHLERFLTVIQQSGFTFNIKKCNFAQPEIKFLGNVVGSGHYKADSVKVDTLHGLKDQRRKKVRQILGFFGHFQSYIPSYAHIAKCLMDSTTKRTPNKINWTRIHEDAFNRFKSLLIEASITPFFVNDYNSPFNISLDASNHSVSIAN